MEEVVIPEDSLRNKPKSAAAPVGEILGRMPMPVQCGGDPTAGSAAGMAFFIWRARPGAVIGRTPYPGRAARVIFSGPGGPGRSGHRGAGVHTPPRLHQGAGQLPADGSVRPGGGITLKARVDRRKAQ